MFNQYYSVFTAHSELWPVRIFDYNFFYLRYLYSEIKKRKLFIKNKIISI